MYYNKDKITPTYVQCTFTMRWMFVKYKTIYYDPKLGLGYNLDKDLSKSR